MALDDFSDLLGAVPNAPGRAPADPTSKPAATAASGDFADLLNIAPNAKTETDPDQLFDFMLKRESNNRQLNADGSPVTSKKGAIGIAQVMPGTAPEAAALAGLPYDDLKYRTDAEYNKALGRAYFNKQLQDFGDPAKAIAAYNAGPGALRVALAKAEKTGQADAWLNFLPPETRAYVPAILSNARRRTVTSSPTAAYSNTQRTPVPARTTWEAVKDNALGLGAGVVQGVGAIAGAFGADNTVSRGADEMAQGMIDQQSEQRKAQRVDRAQAIRDAEQSGSTWEEIKANLGAFVDAPLETTLNALGTSAPTLLMSFIPGLGQATAARLILQGATGAAQGAGAVKNSIYEAVERKLIDQGATPDEAKKVAAGAQAYDSANGGNIAAGTILGVVAGSKGIESAAANIMGAGGRSMARTLPGKAALGVASESIPEGAQGGQERYASNVALQNEGFIDTPTWQGVAGQAAGEAIASSVPGGVFGALEPSRVPPALKPVADKAAEPNTPLSKAAIAGVQAGAAAAPAAPEPQVDPAQRLAELEAIGRGTPERTVAGPDGQPMVIPAEPGRFFTEDEKAEYDRLVKLRNGTPGMTGEQEDDGVDRVLERTKAIEQLLRTNDGLQRLRSEDSPYSVKQFLDDLARAKSASTPAAAREQALNRIETVAEWMGIDLTQVKTPAPGAKTPAAPQTRTEEVGRLVTGATDLSAEDRSSAIEALSIYRNKNLPQKTRQAALDRALEIVGRTMAPQGTPAPARPAAVLGDIPPQEGTPEYYEREAQRREDGAYQFRSLGYDEEANALLAEADSMREMAASARAGELGMEDNADVDVAAPVKAQTVDEATAGLPRLQIPALTAADAGEGGTALRRKRKAQLAQLAGNGYDTVERREDGFVLRNTKTGQEVLLDSPADAQLARAAIKDHVDRLAHTAAASPNNDRLEPTEAQIAAGNYKKSDVIDINGVKVKIENPAGSVRRGVGPDGKPWETTMVHHYGEIMGAEGADGDKVDVFIGNQPASKRVFVVDQVNPDGSFDEHKVIFGAVDEDDARRTYLANYEPGWQGLGAITEVPIGELKPWLKNNADKPAAQSYIGTFEVRSNGQTYRLSAVPVDALPATSEASPGRGGQGKRITKDQALLLKGLAGVFGKDIVFYADPDNNTNSDGFVQPGDDSRIYINQDSGISPLAVFGHELMHMLKRENPQAYAAIAAVLRKRVTNPKGFREDYYGKDSAEAQQDGPLSELELEELISDLNGNLMRDDTFWQEVFAEIESQAGPQARSIIAQLAAFVQKLLQTAARAFAGQNGFRANQFINDTADVREAFRKALAQYAKERGITKQAMQADILRADQQLGDIQASLRRPEPRRTVNVDLPDGPLEQNQWASLLMDRLPEEAAQLLDVQALSGNVPLSRVDLAELTDRLQPQIQRSAKRARDEYQAVVDQYRDSDQWLRAPDGTATALTEQQWAQVRTPSFKAWFGDWEAAYKAGGVWAAEPGTVSVAVGDNGEPLVLYHGSDKGGFVEFDEPSGSKRGDLGIFTTSNRNMARSYVRRNRAGAVDLPADPQSKADLEALDYQFYKTDDGKVEVTAPDGYFQGSYESMDDAVKDTIDNFKMPDLAGTRPGVYALFANIRDPNETDFEGAFFSGERPEQFIVVDEDGEQQYRTEGQGYFSDVEAQAFADEIGGQVEPAPEHYETTDSVVSEARRSKNDGAIIRNVIDDGGGPSSYMYEPSDVFVLFRPNQVKSADYNNGVFDPQTNDIRRSARRGEEPILDLEERVRFSKARPDQKIDPKRVPVFRFKDFIGRFMFATIADRTAAGGEYTGIDGAITEGVPLQGGPGFPLLLRNFNLSLIWANEGPAVAGRKRNIIEQYGKPLMAVSLGQLDMHKSNATAVLSYLRTLESYIKKGRVKLDELDEVSARIRLLKLGKDKKTSDAEDEQDMLDMLDMVSETPADKKSDKKSAEQKKAAAPVVDPNELAKFPGFRDTKALHDFIEKATFDARAAIVDELGKARSEKIGLPSADKLIRKLTDPEFAGAGYLDTVLILEPHTEDTFIKLGEQGSDKHLSYSYALKGRVVGRLAVPVNAREIWSDWWAEQYARKLDEKKRFLEAYNSGDASGLSKDEFKVFSKLIQNKANLGKLLARDFDGLISMERAFTLGMPVMEITPELAKRLDQITAKPAPNVATAKAAVAFMNNDWATSDVAKNKGGTSAADFARELRQSDASATLDLYTEQELVEATRGWKWTELAGKKVKEPVQKMRLFQLRGQRIQFALKYGRPFTYGLDVPGITDNEVTLTSVVNNELGVNGIGGPAIMIRAIEEGATFLDAYAVTSQRFPAGFLPTLYNEYGFQEVGRVPADPQYVTDDHKYAWKQFGWKEGDKLPDIVLMKWKGTDEQRKGLLERYLREGAASLRGSAPDRAAEAGLEFAAGQGDQAQRSQPGVRRGARGDQGTGDRASLASRAYAAVAQLRGLNNAQLRNLGLDPKQVRGQPAESRARLSTKRLTSADKIKWRDLQDVRREIALDKLPDHVMPFGNFMRYMAQKAAVGAISPRDILKAYTITRSSVNRGAISTDKARSGGLQLPADFQDETVRPEGAFAYWLLSPAGQDYLNDAELGRVNQDAIDDAVAVMKPWGMSNMLGEDLARAVTDDIGSLSLQVSYLVSKAHRGSDMVQQWQQVLDSLYGIGYAKKGFMGAMLGYGQLPTFDARQINIQVEPESRRDVLNALATNRAPEVVETLARRLDALDLTMSSEFQPFKQHLVHHAVWDAVGKSETTHSDVVDAMLRASTKRTGSEDEAITIDVEGEATPATRDTVPAAEARGRKVSYEVEVEDSGDTATMTVDAGQALTDYDQRIVTMKKLLECLRK